MEKPDKEKFIEILSFLKKCCGEHLTCERCEFRRKPGGGCLLEGLSEYWDIDQIVENLYGKEV